MMGGRGVELGKNGGEGGSIRNYSVVGGRTLDKLWLLNVYSSSLGNSFTSNFCKPPTSHRRIHTNDDSENFH